jgi:putative transposase
MYEWRKMTDEERAMTLAVRRGRRLPWHSPPHLEFGGEVTFMITAACYEHAPVVGKTPERINDFESALLEICQKNAAMVFAWCVLPNHYHILVRTEDIKHLRNEIGKVHGRSSFLWNREDHCQGRKVWHNCFDRDIKSNRHFWASLNYIHHNPVYHGYVPKWPDWPFSSANQYLEKVGRDHAAKIWNDYPILDYGKDWDIY